MILSAPALLPLCKRNIMIRTEVVLGVKDVAVSSAWYRQLLGCQSGHGGDIFEILTNEEGATVLSLHKWGEHHHPTLTDPSVTPGNGLLLYFKTDRLMALWENALEQGAVVEAEPHLNQNSGQEEFSLRDPDGYYISVST